MKDFCKQKKNDLKPCFKVRLEKRLLYEKKPVDLLGF